MSLRPVNASSEIKTPSLAKLAPAPETSAGAVEEPLTFDQLTETERSAASLGVDPSAFKPIKFLNDAHYETLLRSNAIDGDLAKKLEAYKVVSMQ